MFGINRVLDAFWVGMIFGTILALSLYLSNPEVDGGPSRLTRWRDRLLMWSKRRRERRMASMEVVSIPVSRSGMEPAGMDAREERASDIDAVNAGMPRLSRDLSSNDMIVLLATQRGPGGKPRYSANAIRELVGGDRNTVLALIREVRSGPLAPVFPPLTPEQQQQRKDLGLPVRQSATKE